MGGYKSKTEGAELAGLELEPPENVSTIQFTEVEGQALVECLDAACRAGGIQIAGKAALWLSKLQNSVDSA